MVFSLINWEYEIDGSFLSLSQVSVLGNEGACYFLTIQGFSSSLCLGQITQIPVLRTRNPYIYKLASQLLAKGEEKA